MRAIVISQPGDADVLQVRELARPSPGVGQVLIEVAAFGINRPDILQRRGLYAAPVDASPLPGLEVAGRIVSLGADVTRWQVGDAVCALVHGGGYAEFCVAQAAQCLPVPSGWSLLEAATLPETCFTVWHNLFQRGRLRSHESVLIHGGGSGIGVTAVQLAKLHGCTVLVTVGSAEKATRCLELGADVAIPYHEQDFVLAAREATRGRGVDVILDMVAGDYIPRNLKLLADDGRLVVIAVQGGAQATLSVADLMLRRLTLTGSTLRARTQVVKDQLARDVYSHVWPHLTARRFRPVIHQRFEALDIASAHRLMESGQHFGKLVATWRDDAATPLTA